MTLRVFLVDDHELIRWGLRTLLDAEADLEVVGEAATAGDAVRRLAGARPDRARGERPPRGPPRGGAYDPQDRGGAAPRREARAELCQHPAAKPRNAPSWGGGRLRRPPGGATGVRDSSLTVGTFAPTPPGAGARRCPPML